jgi:glycosyltransferase involved in cell wall biosynthesis
VRISVLTTEPFHPSASAGSADLWAIVEGLSHLGLETTVLSSSSAGGECSQFDGTPRVSYVPREGRSAPWISLSSPAKWHIGREYRHQARSLIQNSDLTIDHDVWTAGIGTSCSSPRITTVHYLASMDPGPNDLGVRLSPLSRLRSRRYEMFRSRMLRESSTYRLLGYHMMEPFQSITSAQALVIPYSIDASQYQLLPPPASSRRVYGCIINTAWRPSLASGLNYLTKIRPMISAIDQDAIHVVGGHGSDALRDSQCRTRFVGQFTSMQAFLSLIDVLVVPGALGSGVRVKVLEALASGVPVAGGECASRGVFEDAGWTGPLPAGVHLAPEDLELASAAVDLAKRRREAPEMGMALREYIGLVHAPRVIARQLASVAPSVT